MGYDFTPLEFDSFIDILSCGFLSSFAKRALKDMKVSHDTAVIYARQNEIKQAIELAVSGLKPVDDDSDFYRVFADISEKNKSFEPLDFIIIKNFLVTLERIKDIISGKKYKYLEEYAASFYDYSDLKNIISSSIDDKGAIKDDATRELLEIRKTVNEFKNKIRKKLSSVFNSANADKYIQDKVIVIRNGRYTIPCKTNFSQYIQGIIQDKSTTGQTLYIEPSSCVSENNGMQEMIMAESEEIAKIIYNLVTSVELRINDLKNSVEKYAYLAMIMEIGYFYSDKERTFGEIGEKVEMNGVHHPLLYLRKGEESVPIDFCMNAIGEHIVITGPNTGGKTAALKSIGLNHLISFLGFPVFGQSFKFVLFDGIKADIGDNQSIAMDLSTFSAHILNIKAIIEKADSKSLILFDELGTGTEPREGACLAYAILKYLRAKGATVVVTTHFTEIKNYALNNDNACFYSVDFDYESLAPRYRLIRDVMGKSDPIMIAERLGFKPDIIDEAKREVSKYKSSLEVRVEELNRRIAENEREKKLLDMKAAELEVKERELAYTDKELQKRLNAKELYILEEAYGLLQKSKRLAEGKSRDRGENIDNMLRSASERISAIKDGREIIKDIKAGDVIYLEKYGKTAKITEIAGDTVGLNMEGIRIKLKRRDIVGYKANNTVKPQPVKVSESAGKSGVRREILLVGKRAEEAIDLLDVFIDDILLKNYDKAYIIHGRGTGALRKAVHDYLRGIGKIKKYYLADNSEGGNAVTVIEL